MYQGQHSSLPLFGGFLSLFFLEGTKEKKRSSDGGGLDAIGGGKQTQYYELEVDNPSLWNAPINGVFIFPKQVHKSNRQRISTEKS